MKLGNSFGNWLKARRKALDLTQFDLADQVGCSVNTIRKIEADERRPSKQIAEHLADVLAISSEERAEFLAFARHTETVPATPPLSKSTVKPRHNLPPQPNSFIGRTDELAQIAERLADPTCRLLTLVGAGGIGKTRLALRAVAEQLDHFASGVYFVSLTGVGASNLVASAIASALEISFYGPEDLNVQLVKYLRGKAMLFILDNFEHLLGATSLLTDILAAAPRVKILTTSRERLNLQEEWVIVVEELASDAAVELFVQRARQTKANFSLEQTADSVLAICRAVEGMPLALELAASWLRVMTCQQIVSQLAHSLDFLITSARNAPVRHRSMRAVFDHSWKLLTPDEQAVFRKLSVFGGGFALEAAEQVASASLHTLTTLVDKSLVRCTSDGRYDLHELLRQYAEQQLEAAGESEVTLVAHSVYYLDFLAQRDADVKGRRQMAAVREIRTDFDNIRVAWQWASEHCQYEAISRAVNCLMNYGEMTSSLPDVRWLLKQTTAAWMPSANVPAHSVREQIQVRCEWVNYRLVTRMDHELVRTILGRARERDDRKEVAWCLWVLYDYAYSADNPDYAHAWALAEEALALRRSLGDPFYTAHALHGLSSRCHRTGQVERGLDCLRESVAIRHELGDKHGLVNSLAHLGERLSHLLRFSEGETYLDQAIAVNEEVGGTAFSAYMGYMKAAFAFWRGRFEVADQFVQAGLDFVQDQDFIGGRSFTLTVLSYLLNMDGDYRRPRELCEQANGVVRYRSFNYVNWGLALACCGSGDDITASQSIRDTFYDAVYIDKSPLFQLLCVPLMSILSTRTGYPQRAVELLGLFSTAPRELTMWADKWPLLTRARAELEVKLGAESFAAAWAEGRALSLEQVVADTLKKSDEGT